MRRSLILLTIAVTCGPLAAQEPQAQRPGPTPVGPQSLFRNALIPIHTQATDPRGGAYGVWAAGRDYKVSFHDGFTFVPYLGSAYPHNQPLRWQTTRVELGGRDIVDVATPPTRSFTDLRYEYHFGGGELVEAYDVRSEGVEQTFTLASRPAAGGDLVIEGRITTRAMDAMPRGDQHGPLTFFDRQGRALVSYGEAWVLDARRDRIPVLTSFDGEHLRLRVPGDWLRDAEFPITVDPVVKVECISSWSSGTTTGQVTSTDIGRDDTANQPAIACTRQASAVDGDLWVWLFDDDSCTHTGRNLIFSDINTVWDTNQTALAFGGNTDRWVIAFTRVFSATSSGVRLHCHDSGNTSFEGSVSFVTAPAGFRDRNVDVGGTRSFTATGNAMIVFERDPTSTYEDTAVHGAIVDATTATAGPSFAITATSSSLDAEAPAINQVSAGNGDGWIVVFQIYKDTTVNDDWDLLGARYDDNGLNAGPTWTVSGAADNDTHRRAPRVEGLNGRYLVTFTTFTPGTPLTKGSGGAGQTITAERIDWPIAGSPTNGPTEIAWPQSSVIMVNTGLAFDDSSRVLWYATFDNRATGVNYVATIGQSAGRVSLTVLGNPALPGNHAHTAATFNNDLNEVQLSYGQNRASGHPTVPCGGSSGQHPVYSVIVSGFACTTPATSTITSRPTHIPGSTSTNGVPHLSRQGWNVFASDPTGCVPVGASVFFLFGGVATVPGPTVGGWGCGFAPGEVNCFNGPLLVLPGARTWNGTIPVGFAAPINISSNPIFCGGKLVVQPLFASTQSGVDICELLEVTVGI